MNTLKSYNMSAVSLWLRVRQPLNHSNDDKPRLVSLLLAANSLRALQLCWNPAKSGNADKKCCQSQSDQKWSEPHLLVLGYISTLKPISQLFFDCDMMIPRRTRLQRKWSKLRYAFDSTAIRRRRKTDMFLFCSCQIGSRRTRYIVVGS